MKGVVLRNKIQDKFYIAFITAILAILIIFMGKSKTLPSGVVTIQLNGINNQELVSKINDALKNIEGIRPVYIDKKSNTCTIRYDSSVVNYDLIKSSLINFGIKVEKNENLNKNQKKPEPILKIRIIN
ncbi:MAG: hypothetical protein H0Z29_00450 [Candidatus Marinimicrobia bacterium]|nr:hypothetical protein [Candidatus Neomarinimicrobiota bacterium]